MMLSPVPPAARRPGVWIFALAAAVLVGLLVLRVAQTVGNKSAQAAKPAIPTVTVTAVGRSAAPTTVTIIGTIDARYDMPIGVEGDGGRVAAIYVEAGDHVRQGQLLARLNVAVLKPQVGSLAASLEQARAEAELAAAEYRRAEAVGTAGALSAEETERRRSAAVTAAARVKVSAAQLAEAQARLDRADVRAPADGTILTRNVELGQTATAGGEALFRLSRGGEIELRGQVAEQDLPLLRPGQTAAVRLTGINRPFEGRVRLLGAVIDPQTRLGTVRIALPEDPNLRPGAFARAEVTISDAERAVLPQTAVLTDDRGTYVLIVGAQGRIERRAVRVTGIVSNGVTIEQGLSGDEQVVATAGAFLQEGEVVNAVGGTAETPPAPAKAARRT
jgi:RND family efflux transporter MFP subunit